MSRGSKQELVITGAGGTIGRILREELAREYAVRGLDVVPGRGIDVVADMRKPRRVGRAFEGAYAVVDLAADSSTSASWDAVWSNNIPAALNALEAARLAGLRRVVLASSNHVTGLYERDEPYASVVAGRYEGLDPRRLRRLTADDPIRPDGPYGVGKAFAEAAGRYYSEVFGLSVICLRIGTVNRSGRPEVPRHFATLLTHSDLVHLVRCSLDAPDSVRFGVYYGVSANKWRLWDIDEARAQIAYLPGDDAERWR